MKTVDNPTPNPGATINYTLTVNASGTATSTGAVASDTLPAELTFEGFKSTTSTVGTSTYDASSSDIVWNIGDLSPGASTTLTVSALVNATDAVGTPITNIAFVGASPSSTNPGTNASSSVTVTVTSPGCTGSSCGGGSIVADVSVTKIANVTSTAPSSTVMYTITAKATGPNPSTGVVVTDEWPSGLTLATATPSLGTVSTSTGTSTVTWNVGTLDTAATSSATLTLYGLVPANASGTITNTALIAESSTLTNQSTSTIATVTIPVIVPTVPTSTPNVIITKTADPTDPAPGGDVTYTVTVTNDSSASATVVYVNDPLPTGLDFVSSSVSQSGDGKSYVLTPSSFYDWNVGMLGANATATLTVIAQVPQSAANGQQITNVASVYLTSATPVGSSTATITVTVPSSGCISNCGGGGGGTSYDNVGIVKTVDNSTPATGATIHYTLTANNTGPNRCCWGRRE